MSASIKKIREIGQVHPMYRSFITSKNTEDVPRKMGFYDASYGTVYHIELITPEGKKTVKAKEMEAVNPNVQFTDMEGVVHSVAFWQILSAKRIDTEVIE